MKDIYDYFVPWVKGIPMYISNHIDLAWCQPELHRMMSNENPIPTSQKVMEAIEKYGAMANRYPDQGLIVRSKIAEINHLDGPENVMLGNGSSEILDMIFRCFLAPGNEVIQQTPCFFIYKLRCNILGGKLISTSMIYKDKRFIFDPDAIIAAITPNTKMIVLANPNNPTGNLIDTETFVKIAETGVPFIADEAYVDYAGLGRSAVDLTKKYKNLIISRTLSKAYGLAGLRFGYALGHKDVIGQISAALLPWNVGTIPMWAGLAALDDTEGLAERIEFNKCEIQRYENSLKDIAGLDIYPGQVNFLLFDGTDAGKKGDGMVDYAMERGLIFRSEPPKYDRDGWFRLSIGSEEENSLAIKIIREYFGY
jgi:histidinol-phosphate aminotransferase